MSTETTISSSAPAAGTAPASPAPAPAVEAAPLVARDKATPGEKLYKGVVHGGINFFTNESIGMAFAWMGDFGKDKKFGAHQVWKVSTQWRDALTKNLQKTISMGPTLSKDISGLLIGIGLLSMGGNLLMAPIKMIEDHKLYWVKKADAWLDRLHGHKDVGAQEQLDRDAAYSRIAQEEKPSWGRVIKARVASLGFNVATLFAWKAFDRNPVDDDRRGTGRISNWAADKVLGSVKPPGYEYPKANIRWFINMGLLETISTLNTMMAFYVKYEIFDRKKEKAKLQAQGVAEPTRTQTDPSPALVAAASIPSAENAPTTHAMANETSEVLAAQAVQQQSSEQREHAPVKHPGSATSKLLAEHAHKVEGHGGRVAPRGETHAATVLHEKQQQAEQGVGLHA